MVCFISNYSWLDGRSFAGMRERYLEAFDAIRIDCLNGDKYKTGKVAPDGSPDPSIFSTPDDPVGIQVGTAIATLVRKLDHASTGEIGFRHLWGQAKREELTATAEAEPGALYDSIEPVLPLGLPFVRTAVSKDWFDWPALPDLFPVSFPGAKTNRDSFLVDIDLDRLKARIADYFDASLSHDEIARRYPVIMKTARHFDARSTRDALLTRGGPNETGFVQFVYRPFDSRWLYWEAETKLLNDSVPNTNRTYLRVMFGLKLANEKPRKISHVALWFATLRVILGMVCRVTFPPTSSTTVSESAVKAYNTVPICPEPRNAISNVSAQVWRICSTMSSPPSTPPLTVRPMLGRSEWNGRASRYPAGPMARLKVRRMLLCNRRRGGVNWPGCSCSTPTRRCRGYPGALRPETAAIAVPATTAGRNMTGDDFALTAGWGHYGSGNAVMPGQGRIVEREYTAEERTALGAAISVLGENTLDVYLNDRAFWRNIPAAIWGYKLGGYQVLKKWLSYREKSVLKRALKSEEVAYFAEAARRIGGILQLVANK